MICVQSPSEPTTFTSCPGYRVPRTEPFVLASERTFTPSVAVAVPLAAPLEDDAEDEDERILEFAQKQHKPMLPLWWSESIVAVF